MSMAYDRSRSQGNAIHWTKLVVDRTAQRRKNIHWLDQEDIADGCGTNKWLASAETSWVDYGHEPSSQSQNEHMGGSYCRKRNIYQSAELATPVNREFEHKRHLR